MDFVLYCIVNCETTYFGQIRQKQYLQFLDE